VLSQKRKGKREEGEGREGKKKEKLPTAGTSF
jgi:hypothetical protein